MRVVFGHRYQTAVLAPDRDDAPVLNPRRHVAPRLAELLLVAEELPASPEDLGPLDLIGATFNVANLIIVLGLINRTRAGGGAPMRPAPA